MNLSSVGMFSGLGIGRKSGGSDERNLRNRIKVEMCHWYKMTLEQGGIGGVMHWELGEACNLVLGQLPAPEHSVMGPAV